MGLPFIFANVTELDTPALDSNFNALGALTIIPCTAVGTNAITLSPVAGAPTISAYSNNAPIFGFQAAASTTTSPVQLQVGGLGLLNVYKANGAALIGANDFLIGLTYYVAFVQALNSGAGGWVLVNPGASAATAGAVQAAVKNLFIQNGGTPNTQITLTADAVAVSDGATNFTTLLTVNVTISSGTSGANGLDTGAIANSTQYAVYVIYNPSTLTVAGLISTSFTSPTLPSGFTQFARLGSFRTDSSAHFIRILTRGRRSQYVVTSGSNTAAFPLFTSGVGGTYSATVLNMISASTAGFAPPTASRIFITMSNNWNAATIASIGVGPNNNYAGTGGTGTTNPPPLALATNATAVSFLEMELETAAIFYAITAAGGALQVMGWEDNI